MNIRIKALLGLGAATLSVSTMFPVAAQAATASPAISTVACGSSPDVEGYTWLWSPRLPSVCFANAGDMAVNVPGVEYIFTGNNEVQVNYSYGGLYYTTGRLGKNIEFKIPDSTVYEVRIY
jgi:hypothetical protein